MRLFLIIAYFYLIINDFQMLTVALEVKNSVDTFVQEFTYNITSAGATGTQLHCTLEEYVITVVELEHVQVYIVTLDERNTGVNAVEIIAQNVRILTAAGKADESRIGSIQYRCREEQLRLILITGKSNLNREFNLR